MVRLIILGVLVVSAVLALPLLMGVAGAAPLSPGDILVVVEDNNGFVRQYSAAGVDLGIFASTLAAPAWITTDPAGNVYVSEYGGNAIRKFSPAGNLVLTVPTSFTPGGVAIAADGTIYVAHYDAGQVHRFSSSGADLGVFVTYSNCSPNGCGTDFIKFDAAGNLYIGDFQPIGHVRRISPTGVDLGDFVVSTITERGGVEGVGFDRGGNLYVSNYNNTGTCILEKFSPTGNDLGQFATSVCYGFAFDGQGNLYSAATLSGAVEKFSPTGQALGGFGQGGRDLAIVPGPITKEQCRNGGWHTFAFPRVFQNQGDCLTFVNRGR